MHATEGRLGWTQDVIDQWVESKGLPKFASGGITSGISIAGEAGPEAIIPLPDGRSVPVQMTGSADNKEVVDELRALRQEVALLRAQTGQVANNTRKVADYAEKDDVIGLPATRTS